MNTQISFVHRPPALLYAALQRATDPKINRVLHSHNNVCELVFVNVGEGCYILNGRSYPIYPGDFLFSNQGDLHEVQSATHREIGTICFGIEGLELKGLPPGCFTEAKDGYIRPVGRMYEQIKNLCQLMYNQMELGTAQSRDIAQHLFLALLPLALSFPADDRNEAQTESVMLVNRIGQYIAAHFAEPLTLERMGEELKVSPYHAAHVFKEITGSSPIQYVIRRRMGEAQNLLISTDFSAAQIAAMVGYDSASHFNSIFKRVVGLPPVRFRQWYLVTMRGKRKQ
ncbi:AraC family transcriptional regulator [uncultured Oscillibacter sp.]|jgi:AraC-like DNA-binding protein|uniref:AraC family transcriptional regulator n=1 Tax=uncultured Oscillibacter sp. TaxID=876091 RepID=UPI002173F034|nr:AraC family transcriptional regulator [uncultured Oscillibacter sp.]MCI9554713.1 AraC family transcriptional regulator [Oscillibacter sp.]